jgi:hypothetical protein
MACRKEFLSICPWHLTSTARYHTTIRGPQLPSTRLQRMAGLWRAAQLMYWRGAAQKVTGAILVMW